MNSLYRLLNPTREDGYSVRGLMIQGVRSYDSNTEQWTTPDAYKGDVDDPMSQRGYMWNNNNPASNADPTGFSSDSDPPGPVATLAWPFGMPVVYDTNGNPVTHLPYNEESAENGAAWAEPPGRTITGVAVGAVLGEDTPPFVSVPASIAGGIGGGYLAGAGARVYCGYGGGCGAPPAWWGPAWDALDLFDLLHSARAWTCGGGCGSAGASSFAIFRWSSSSFRRISSWEESALEDPAGLGGDADQILESATANGQQHQPLTP